MDFIIIPIIVIFLAGSAYLIADRIKSKDPNNTTANLVENDAELVIKNEAQALANDAAQSQGQQETLPGNNNLANQSLKQT
jgi:hypothetical protein